MKSIIVGVVILFTLQLYVLSVEAAPQLSKHPVVLVVSFDGFRYDYLEKTDTPNLKALQREGVTVPYMTPQFPSNTFPNHHSIATGLTPDNHGVTDNTFYDPLLGKNLSGFNDDWEFWNYSPDVLPFYIRNELAGDERYSGCYMWAGSSTPYGASNEYRPTHYVAYNANIPWSERVDTVIEWMTDADKPTNMVFLYYNEPDSAGHSFGTDDDRTIQIIKESDDRAGLLFEKLKAAEIYDRINIIILADHGMQTVTRETIINTTDIIDRNLYQRLGSTPVYHIFPKDVDDTDRIYEAFKAASFSNRFSVYRKEELTHLKYSQNRRIMPILLLADPGFAFENVNPNPNYGVHGYNPSFLNMSAIFIAAGPQFKRGYTSQLPVNNIDLVPMFAKIMNVSNVPSDGTIERVELLLALDATTGAPTDAPTVAPTDPPEDNSAVRGASITAIVIAIAQIFLFKI